MFVHARAVQKNASSVATNRVTFTHTSENFTLHQVWIEGSDTGYDLVHNEMDNDI